MSDRKPAHELILNELTKYAMMGGEPDAASSARIDLLLKLLNDMIIPEQDVDEVLRKLQDLAGRKYAPVRLSAVLLEMGRDYKSGSNTFIM